MSAEASPSVVQYMRNRLQHSMKSHSDLKTLREALRACAASAEEEEPTAEPTSTLTVVSIARVATCSEVLAQSQE